MRKQIKISMAIVALFLFAISCKNISMTEVDETDPPTVTDTVYSSDHPYNLNVVYFVPSEVTPNANYKQRLSKYVFPPNCPSISKFRLLLFIELLMLLPIAL